MRNSLTKLGCAVLIAFLSAACVSPQDSNVQQQPASPLPTVSQKQLPEKSGAINDYANVFDEEGEKRLKLMTDELRRDVQVVLAVLTVETTAEQSMFDYSLAIARAWNLGSENGRGLLLTLAIKDRQWRLQVSKALEAELPNDVADRLAQPSVEFYKQGKYTEGVDRYVRAISDHLREAKAHR